MQPIQAGISALVTAYARAYHATHDSPKIFDDFLADQLYTAEEHLQFDQSLAEKTKELSDLYPDWVASATDQAAALALEIQLMHGPITLSRSRYNEDRLEEAIAQRVRQYVLLGAGFDTFAFRRQDLLDKVEVFEIDHPVTQSMKRERIARVGWSIPPQLHFVPVDFTQTRLSDALLATAYDPHCLTLFSWLGVTYYLPREVAFATLQSIAQIAPSGSAIIFDYMDANAFDPGKVAPRTALIKQGVAQIGEPMITGFDPQTLGAELDALGLGLHENLTPADIETRYFQSRTDRYHAFEHFHFAWAKVK
jgi:methyltransferase (TIGR00027 family)